MEMKLYVWTGFNPDWSGGMAVALAASEADARKMVEDCNRDAYGVCHIKDWGDLAIYPADKPVAFSVDGGG